MRVENFDLKWAMCSGVKRFPNVPWWSEAGQIPKRVPRRVNIEIVYFQPNEYISPLTGESLPCLVVRFTKKIRQSSWSSWRPMERLEVNRFYATRLDESQHWSPNKRHGGWKIKYIEELGYEYDGYNRDCWFPTLWSFFADHGTRVYTNLYPFTDPSVLSLTYDSITDSSSPPAYLNTRTEIVNFITPRTPPPRISYRF